ncbi:MAG: hypothetical protein ACTSQN_07310 [Candidatus Heimdallarchaeota archaeon]
MGDFDSIADYLEAKLHNVRSPAELDLNRDAIVNNWPDYKTVKDVWKHIFNCKLTKHKELEQKGRDLFKDITNEQAKEPIYELMPPFDENCKEAIDWKLWFYGHLNGWKSFGEILTFAKDVLPNFDEIIVDDHWKYIYLTYITLHGPFKNTDDWLQGWPDIQTIIDFWNAKNLGSDTGNRLQKINWARNLQKMKKLNTIYQSLFKFPLVPTYDPDCKVGFEWIIWILAQQTGWSNFKQLLDVLDSKDPKINQLISDKILYQFAIRNPKDAKKIQIMVDDNKRNVFFNIDGTLTDIKKL